MFVCSVSHWASGLSTLFYLCGWFAGFNLPSRGLGSGSWCFVTTLLSSLTLFSLFAVVVTLFWSLFILEAALSLSSIHQEQQRTFPRLKLIMNSFTHWLIVFLFVCFFALWLHGKGNTAPFEQCGSPLFILCCKWIWRVTVWLRPRVVLDWTGPNCGREAWAEECA